MGLYQAVAGAKITAAEWNTIYNLLKGIVGGEDPVRLAGNVADTFLLQPNTDPASVVHLFPIKTQAGVEKWALRSDGIPVLADQAGTPGSLENGMLWRNGTKFYGRLGDATVELFTPAATKKLCLPPSMWHAYTGTPDWDCSGGYEQWSFDKASDEAVLCNRRVPADWVSGTITVKIRWISSVSVGEVKWGLSCKTSNPNVNPGMGGAWTDITPVVVTVPGSILYWKETTLGAMTVQANQESVIQVKRFGSAAEDTADGVGCMVDVILEYS